MKYKFIDPEDKDFDSIDPDIRVSGYGLYKRSEIRNIIKNIMTSILSRFKKISEKEPQTDILSSLLMDISPDNKLVAFIQADLGASEELEKLRKKGGQRKVDIPKQD